MAGEDQERFEDYLELEHYIEELQAGHTAHPPSVLTPTQASIYRMAALFRSASTEESQPRPEFAAEVRARLEQELQPPAKPRHFPFLSREQSTAPQKRRPRVSRRTLLTGGAAVAASLVVGAGLGGGQERQRISGLHRLSLMIKGAGLRWRSWPTLQMKRFAL